MNDDATYNNNDLLSKESAEKRSLARQCASINTWNVSTGNFSIEQNTFAFLMTEKINRKPRERFTCPLQMKSFLFFHQITDIYPFLNQKYAMKDHVRDWIRASANQNRIKRNFMTNRIEIQNNFIECVII